MDGLQRCESSEAIVVDAKVRSNENSMAQRHAVPAWKWTGTAIAHIIPLALYYYAPVEGGLTFTGDSVTYLVMSKCLFDYPQKPIGVRGLDWDGSSATLNTTFPIGYPLLIAVVGVFGFQRSVAGLLVPFLCYVAASLIMFRLAMRVSGRVGVAIAASCLFAGSFPVLFVAWHAWSEMPAILVALSSLVLLEKHACPEPGRRTAAGQCLSGILGGCTVWFRYAMLPYVPAMILAVGAMAGSRTMTRASALRVGLSALLTATLLFCVNWWFGGSPVGPGRPPATDGVISNAAAMANHIVNMAFGMLGSRSAPASFVASLLLFLLLLVCGVLCFAAVPASHRRRPSYSVAAMFCLLYPVFITVTRSIVRYDPLDNRFTSVMVPFFILAVLVPALRHVRVTRFGLWPQNALRLAAPILAVAYVLGQGTHWNGTASWHQRALRTQDILERSPQLTRLRQLTEGGPEYLLTNSIGAVYAWNPARAICLELDGSLSPDAVTRFGNRVGQPIYVYLAYDHPLFDPGAIGPLAVRLFSGRMGESWSYLGDDGCGRLWHMAPTRGVTRAEDRARWLGP